jgi:hypothetical protein
MVIVDGIIDCYPFPAGFDIRIRDNEGRTVIEWLNEELQKERNKIPSGQLELDKLEECQGILMEYAKMNQRERSPSEGRTNGMEVEGEGKGGGIIRQESDRNWKKLAIEKADRNEGRGMNKVIYANCGLSNSMAFYYESGKWREWH